ncbi:HAD family hydrolase [Caulobacter sp. Root1455]|uniref:HAD hydrolase-like protein n=1 Tax=unclassified Caulobacter TaxID=2648921 RepID=UPI0006FB66D5|nr:MULTISPECIES: HAD hydrolase-like protein [unclassified Caulobacter]KQY29785.1 HAD family hydrolase [Caulobacter sp. Root487D2Y]KQZ05925.1 HAD family hydrolase [Caulobacter sp. Root1455]
MDAQIDLVIFDFDGTLADSTAWAIRAVRPLAERFKFKAVTEDEIAMLRGRTSREIIAYLGLPLWKVPLVAAHGKKMMAADAHAIPLFSGTGDLLRGLSAAGLRLAIVSSNSEVTIRSILGAELAGLVDHYGCGAAIFGKAAKFRSVVKAARIPKDRVLCIGDETRDIEAAREAGLACGAVEWGYATRRALADHGPTMMFAAMDEIISRVAASNHGVGAD